MDLIALISYATVTMLMVLFYFFRGKGTYFEFPFWAGLISGGWFLPQAIQLCPEADKLPEGAYASGLFFAALCNAAMWAGFSFANDRITQRKSWLADDFDKRKLYWAGAVMCMVGFFFQWKLLALPDELFKSTQWSGALVKYLFFASIFKLGFVTIWLLYLSERKWVNVKLLVFIVPCLLLLLQAVVLKGRRGEMMNLFSFIFCSLWLVRRYPIPRVILIAAVCVGLTLVNSIGIYRVMMRDKDTPVLERLSKAAKAVSEEKNRTRSGGSEFRNYTYTVALYQESNRFDYGGIHWNELVFNYVPAQLVGRDFKESLALESGMSAREASDVLLEKFGYRMSVGTTISGYADAYGSFSWFGFVKFLLIGLMMGTLYRHAMNGTFLGQMLYVYVLGTAMHAVSHGTNRILASVWVYFFALAYPLLFRARIAKHT
jgi:hypothetical protein